MATFIAHLGDVGASLAKTVSAFNCSEGSWTSRVAPQLARVDELNGHENADIIEPVDEAVRSIEIATHSLAIDPVSELSQAGRRP